MKPDFETAAQPRFERLRELGRGQGTRVELVYDAKRQRTLAQKIWERTSAELRFRLRQQHRRSQDLLHPNIARVYDLVIDNERTALTLEAVSGVEATQSVWRIGQTEADDERRLTAAVHVLQQLFDALATLHGAGIVHRGIKPRNLLVGDSGRAVLLDAGLSWAPQDPCAAPADPSVVHALPFVAPECIRGALPSIESDWYGFGALAAALLLTESPFSGNIEQMLKAKDAGLSSLRTRRASIPAQLDELLCALVAKDPRVRPGQDDVEEVLASLGGSLAAMGADAGEPPPSLPSHVQLRAPDARPDTELTPAPQSPALPAMAALDDAPRTLLSGDVAQQPTQVVADVLCALSEGEPSNSQLARTGSERAQEQPQVITQSAHDQPWEPRQDPSWEPAPVAPVAAACEADAAVAATPARHELSRAIYETTGPTLVEAALAQIDKALSHNAEPAFVCVRGARGAGKTAVCNALVQRLSEDPSFCVAFTRGSAEAAALAPLQQLTEQLAVDLGAARISCLQRIEPERRSALARLCPALVCEADQHIDACAAQPQQRLIDAHLGLRTFVQRACAVRRVVFVIDDAQLLAPDTLAALRALFSTRGLPELHVVFALDSAGMAADVFAALLDGLTDARSAPRVVELDPFDARRSRPPHAASEHASATPQSPQFDSLEALLAAAGEATELLALQRAAELLNRALLIQDPPSSKLLSHCAQAHMAAGRLREAAQLWRALARCSADATHAQRYEIEAGACLLRAGEQDEALAVMREVLRGVGVSWPRTPVFTSTLERARALLRHGRVATHLRAVDQPPRPLRFEALWGVAKELLLAIPATADALCARALREAQGDPSRSHLLWALGYEATSEANIGGPFMQRRAAGLTAEVRELADASANAYDLAYAGSVEAVVAWFQGDWAQAELRLRGALRAYACVDADTAQERHVLNSFLIGSLEAQGKLAELRELVAEERIAALQTGHRLALAFCELSAVGLLELAQDRALSAIDRADALLGTYGAESGFTPLHFQHFVTTTNARLYAGHHAQAYQQVEQARQQIRRTYLAQLEGVAVMVHQLRARAALALASQSAGVQAERLRAQAVRLSGTLGRSNLTHALAMKHVIEANVAALSQQHAAAEAHCLRASELFDVAGMPLFRELARMARGSVGDGVEAKLDATQSAAYLAQSGVRDPARLVAAYFPALREQLLAVQDG